MAPNSSPAPLVASPFVPVSGMIAMLTWSSALIFKIRDGGGVPLPGLISETYRASPIQTAPSMLVKSLLLLLKSSAGGASTPTLRRHPPPTRVPVHRPPGDQRGLSSLPPP